MIALEKLLLLKSVTFFKETPDDLLLQLAIFALQEKNMQAGELIVQKNDIDTAMYIIVAGKVKIHDGDLLIKELNEREIFGELAALSLSPRISSVSALTDGLLLKMDSNDLYEMMSLDIGLAKGVIKGLCERIQSMSTQLQGLMQLAQIK